MIGWIIFGIWCVIGFTVLRWESKTMKTKYKVIHYLFATIGGLITVGIIHESLGVEKLRYNLSWCDMTHKKLKKAKKKHEKKYAKYEKDAMEKYTVHAQAIVTVEKDKHTMIEHISKPYVRSVYYNEKFWEITHSTVDEVEIWMVNKLKKNGVRIGNVLYPWHSIKNVEFIRDGEDE